MTAGETTTDVDCPIPIDTETDLDSVLAGHEVVLIELYTEGCSLCESMGPILTNVSRATDATVVTVNPRDDPPLVERFRVQSVPKFVLFANGKQVAERAEGFVPHDELVAWVEEQTG